MLLGQILIRRGYCKEKDILHALDLQRHGDKRFLGEILLSEGKVTENQLKEALEVQFGKYPKKKLHQRVAQVWKKLKTSLFR